MCWIQFAISREPFIHFTLSVYTWIFISPLFHSLTPFLSFEWSFTSHAKGNFLQCLCGKMYKHFFHISLFPTSDNYCNKLYKNKIAILLLKRHLFDDEYLLKRKKNVRPTFVSMLFFTRLLICDFFFFCRLHCSIS